MADPGAEIGQCRICLDDCPVGQLLTQPCGCAGTLRHVHHGCLQAWAEARGGKITECEVCQQPYYWLHRSRRALESAGPLGRSGPGPARQIGVPGSAAAPVPFLLSGTAAAALPAAGAAMTAAAAAAANAILAQARGWQQSRRVYDGRQRGSRYEFLHSSGAGGHAGEGASRGFVLGYSRGLGPGPARAVRTQRRQMVVWAEDQEQEEEEVEVQAAAHITFTPADTAPTPYVCWLLLAYVAILGLLMVAFYAHVFMPAVLAYYGGG